VASVCEAGALKRSAQTTAVDQAVKVRLTQARLDELEQELCNESTNEEDQCCTNEFWHKAANAIKRLLDAVTDSDIDSQNVHSYL